MERLAVRPDAYALTIRYVRSSHNLQHSGRQYDNATAAKNSVKVKASYPIQAEPY